MLAFVIWRTDSNTTESVKLIHKIILPYDQRERSRLDSEGQHTLLIIDVLEGRWQNWFWIF